MIGKAMETWPSDALRRVVDAPVEAWVFGSFGGFSRDTAEVGCLLTHACADYGFGTRKQDFTEVGLSLDMRYTDTPEDVNRGWAFVAHIDGLHARFGLPRLVRALKQRALRILEQRDATLGEPARDGVRSSV